MRDRSSRQVRYVGRFDFEILSFKAVSERVRVCLGEAVEQVGDAVEDEG